MDIKKYLKDRASLVDSFLSSYMKKPLKPERLRQSVSYSLMAGGKRLRPILVLATAEALGKDLKPFVRYASALEFVHTYSLIHDDLPAMDDDDLRRGKPTNHVVFGEAMAILAGDALLTEAFLLLSEPSKTVKPGRLIEAVRELAIGSGFGGMVAGQAMDILSEEQKPDRKTLSFIHKNKTGALITASVRIGAILGGASEKKLAALTKYAECAGLAFQIVDDILDVTGTTEELGKPAGSDAENKKMTYPALFGVEKSRQKARSQVASALKAIEGFPRSADALREIVKYIEKRSS